MLYSLWRSLSISETVTRFHPSSKSTVLLALWCWSLTLWVFLHCRKLSFVSRRCWRNFTQGRGFCFVSCSHCMVARGTSMGPSSGPLPQVSAEWTDSVGSQPQLSDRLISGCLTTPCACMWCHKWLFPSALSCAGATHNQVLGVLMYIICSLTSLFGPTPPGKQLWNSVDCNKVLHQQGPSPSFGEGSSSNFVSSLDTVTQLSSII